MEMHMEKLSVKKIIELYKDKLNDKNLCILIDCKLNYYTSIYTNQFITMILNGFKQMLPAIKDFLKIIQDELDLAVTATKEPFIHHYNKLKEMNENMQHYEETGEELENSMELASVLINTEIFANVMNIAGSFIIDKYINHNIVNAEEYAKNKLSNVNFGIETTESHMQRVYNELVNLLEQI